MSLSRRRVGAILALVIVLSALLVPAASAAPVAGGPTVYWVKYGDTLYKIAARYGVSAWSIASANNLRNWNRIYAGQKLIIPGTYNSYGPCGYNACPPPKPPAPPPYGPCGYNPCPPPKPPAPPPYGPCGYNPCQNQPSNNYGPWQGTFYNSTDLSGSVVAQYQYSAVNFDWGWNPPVAGMPNCNWSARFTSNPNLNAGRYRVQVTVDDGVRVYINGTLVIDSWQVQAATTYTQDVWLGGGNTNITIEYYQAQGVASLRYSMWPY